MAVSVAVEIRPVTAFYGREAAFELDNEFRYYEGLAKVTGDVSGGNADVRILFPKEDKSFYFIRKLFLGHLSSQAFILNNLAAFEDAAGGSWTTQSIRLTTNASGYLEPEDSVNVMKLVNPIMWHSGNLAALQPAVQFEVSNSNGTTYVLGLQAEKVSRQEYEAGVTSQMFSGL